MLKNVNSQIGRGSQNETKKTPDISHLTGIARSFHFKPCTQPEKFRFRLIYDHANGAWRFVPLDFMTIKFVASSERFFPWPMRGRNDTWRLSQPWNYSPGGVWLD